MVTSCSINMRIFKSAEFLLFSILFTSTAAFPGKPSLSLRLSSDDSVDDKPPLVGDHYDQRQNGTENYRIHVDGLVLVVAPIEGLLLAGGVPGVSDSNIFGTQQPDNQKPKPEETTGKPTTSALAEEKPPSGKSSHGPGLRLINLLSPFLRRIHHSQE